VGFRVVLDAAVKRKVPNVRWESNPKTPMVQPVAQSLYRLSYHGSKYLLKQSVCHAAKDLNIFFKFLFVIAMI
jgi:hypothetical protein